MKVKELCEIMDNSWIHAKINDLYSEKELYNGMLLGLETGFCTEGIENENHSKILNMTVSHFEVEDENHVIIVAFEEGDENLRERRKMKGMSQSQLAKESGVNVRMIQQYEQGAKDINKASGETIYKLAQALGCQMEDLLERTQ